VAKRISKDTIRVQNGVISNCKHNVPKGMLEIICEFKDLDFIREVGVGKFKPSKKEKGGILVGFDDRGKSYLVNVTNGGYEQKFYLGVHSKKEEYEQIIKDVLTKL